jgi:hypothetical protein
LGQHCYTDNFNEGNDDARAKELAREIEEKPGMKREGTDKKETIKAESKKINTK